MARVGDEPEAMACAGEERIEATLGLEEEVHSNVAVRQEVMKLGSK